MRDGRVVGGDLVEGFAEVGEGVIADDKELDARVLQSLLKGCEDLVLLEGVELVLGQEGDGLLHVYLREGEMS